ncbi:MAG TPA: T9SS type A sorting domain-containing protein [Bacteroidia bacterium]
MKRIFTFFLFLPLLSFSQNGLTSYPMPAGYTTSYVNFKNAFALDKFGNKWIGFTYIGLGKFNGTTWTIYNHTNSGLPSDYVTSIAFEPNNTMWVGTDKGLAKYDGASWTVYNKSNSGIVSDTINAISLNGTATYVGSYRGISVFNGSWTNCTRGNSGLASDTINAIIAETNGAIWAGTAKGLSKFSGGIWTTYNTSNSALTYNKIQSLHFDAGNLWIGTNGGGIYQYTSGQITRIDSIYPIWPYQFSSYALSFVKGLQGGILFNENGIDLMEVIPNPAQTKKYFLPATSAGQKYFQKDAAGLLWFVNQHGSWDTSKIKLFSFDISQYVPPPPDYCSALSHDNIKSLDINDVSATILNRGDLHWNPVFNQHGQYEVPKGSGRNPIYASAIWIGGIDMGGMLHLAAQEYRSTGCDLFPGPINVANPAAFDKIWKANRFDIESFKYEWALGNVQNGSYTPAQSIIDWPAVSDTSYAPFVDVNGNGVYDPLIGGDYPKIRGDQSLYFIMNDDGLHAATQCAPMQIEIHGMAYAFTCPQLTDSEQVLNYTTLYHYEFINKSSNVYHKSYFGLWQDGDLGCAEDDYVGCYPAGNYGYYYNGDSVDISCSGEIGYGAHPPMYSNLILNGALADPNDSIDNNNNGIIDEPGEKNLMTSFNYFIGGAAYPLGDPGVCNEFYNYMSSRWQNGIPFTYGGDGFSGTTATHFIFPSFPYNASGWSEITIGDTPGNRRMLMGSGPFTFNPGQKIEYDFAIVWSRDTTLPFMSKAFFDKNLHDNQKIQYWFANNNFPSCLDLTNLAVSEANQNANSISVFPNPTDGKFTVSDLQSVVKSIDVYNIYGELIFHKTVNSKQETISLNEASGVYFLQIKSDNGNIARKIILHR